MTRSAPAGRGRQSCIFSRLCPLSPRPSSPMDHLHPPALLPVFILDGTPPVYLAQCWVCTKHSVSSANKIIPVPSGASSSL
jgi:hypothetical protein